MLEDGAGINVKMFEYFAFGIPVITTEYGTRGILVDGERNCILTKREHYADDIRRFCNMPLKERDKMAQEALELLINEYSWRSLGRKVVREIEDMYGMPVLNNSLSLKEIALYDFAETESYIPEGSFYIRCSGKYGQKCLKFLREKGLEPKAFVDSDMGKNGKTVNGVPVISLTQFLNERREEKVVVAVSCPTLIEVASELLALKVSAEDISLSWDLTGRRIMRLSDLTGCTPHYFDAAKWRREIERRANDIEKND